MTILTYVTLLWMALNKICSITAIRDTYSIIK